MATKKPKKVALDKGKKTRAPRRKKVEVAAKGLSVAEVASAPAGADALREAIAADGGAVLGVYADPIGGYPVVLAALPVDRVEPTPFQRDRSEAHLKKLARSMERVERYLDPIICVRRSADTPRPEGAAEGGGVYWTPNGNHRLGAMKLLGMRSIIALVLPEEEVAYQILALNTEKAHNLKERSLEVIRMYRSLVTEAGDESESDYAAIFDEPYFATIGAAYELRPRYPAGAYAPIVRRLERFLDEPLNKTIVLRNARAKRLIELDDAVGTVVEALKAKGLTSPYLKTFVVSRVNFLRFAKGDDFDFDETLDKLERSVKKMDTAKVTKDDVAKAGGGGPPLDEE